MANKLMATAGHFVSDFHLLDVIKIHAGAYTARGTEMMGENHTDINQKK